MLENKKQYEAEEIVYEKIKEDGSKGLALTDLGKEICQEEDVNLKMLLKFCTGDIRWIGARVSMGCLLIPDPEIFIGKAEEKFYFLDSKDNFIFIFSSDKMQSLSNFKKCTENIKINLEKKYTFGELIQHLIVKYNSTQVVKGVYKLCNIYFKLNFNISIEDFKLKVSNNIKFAYNPILLEECKNLIVEEGYTEDDVLWVEYKDHYITTWENFKTISDFKNNSSKGEPIIVGNMKIVSLNWVLYSGGYYGNRLHENFETYERENLVESCIEVIIMNGYTETDILWVQCEDKYTTWEHFKTIADFDCYSEPDTDMSLKIVGEDWWVERHEDDETERQSWELKVFPKKPEVRNDLKLVDILDECFKRDYLVFDSDEVDLKLFPYFG
ncbi:hypothetical protein G9F71_016385 [Clostridium sp. FP2]|uniref:hypothetical protein n=1 Tax=Clostridium sp. FP2 TaxID=2724481 RepID=UPI0013E94D95|nr:hypothetical protein [Clostridium sp. FP2]MBZ9624430.1 hypothetical protein [Clostridium sp. FP2]